MKYDSVCQNLRHCRENFESDRSLGENLGDGTEMIEEIEMNLYGEFSTRICYHVVGPKLVNK